MKVSIIVPIFGVEKYLSSFLNSLLKTTLEDVEFILINDASKDNCHNLISNVKDNRIIYIKKEVNEGLYKARQDGFNIAKGDYIINLDPDDIISDNYIKKMYDYISTHNLDIVISNVELIDEDGNSIKNRKSCNVTDSCIVEDSDKGRLLGFPYATWCRIFRRSLLILNSYEYKYGELYLTNFHFINGIKSGICSEATYYYRIRNSSMSSHSNSINRLKDKISIDSIESFFDSLPPNIEKDFYFSSFNYNSYIKLIYTSCLNDVKDERYIKLNNKLKELTGYKRSYFFKDFKYAPLEMKIFKVLNLCNLIPTLIKLKNILRG
ncbi:TPA: glycosyltransferase family 2 protein [Photobacterium damselae]